MERDFLTEDELQTIVSRDFGTKRRNHVLDIFVYSCFTGLAYADVQFFKFIWLITCLSHDTAFYLEKDKGLFRACPDIERLKGYRLIDYDLTTQSVYKVPKEMFELCQVYYCSATIIPTKWPQTRVFTQAC